MQIPKSSIPDILWPPVPNDAASSLLALQYQFEHSQWYAPDLILELQQQQLKKLITHTINTVPYYHQTFRNAGIAPDEKFILDKWSQIPLLTPDTVIKSGELLVSRNIPGQHGKTFEHKTSGSTEKILQVLGTELTSLLWKAITLREHLWHQRDFSGRAVMIRSGRYAKDPDAVYDSKGWGTSINSVYDTGPSTLFYNRKPPDKQVEILLDRDPDYLLCYPSIALTLACHFRDHDLKLSRLKQIVTIGETLTPDVRKLCNDIWQVDIKDIYSAEEIGYIALQCPDTENYHIQSETLLVEVLDADGQPCQPGEIGRLVFTTLQNFAMPLIRYANGDYAEVGAQPCPCGRGLPTLKRIWGRERNRLTLPDGKRIWPNSTTEVWANIKQIRQIQILQKELARLEVRVISEKPLNSTDENKLTESLTHVLGVHFEYVYSYLNDIPRFENGKFEPFISELTDK